MAWLSHLKITVLVVFYYNNSEKPYFKPLFWCHRLAQMAQKTKPYRERESIIAIRKSRYHSRGFFVVQNSTKFDKMTSHNRHEVNDMELKEDILTEIITDEEMQQIPIGCQSTAIHVFEQMLIKRAGVNPYEPISELLQ